MNDLISRQALCDDLREYKVHPVPISSDEFEVKGYNDGIDLAISVIAKFPSAEPEERTAKVSNQLFHNPNPNVVGAWIGTCECGKLVTYSSKYCSECGARLIWEKEKDDEDA